MPADPELDARIAREVMGWEHLSYGHSGSGTYPSWNELEVFNSQTREIEKLDVIGVLRGPGLAAMPWSPSSSPADAIEALEASDTRWYMTWQGQGSDWLCWCCGGPASRSDTLPEAISKALEAWLDAKSD